MVLLSWKVFRMFEGELMTVEVTDSFILEVMRHLAARYLSQIVSYNSISLQTTLYFFINLLGDLSLPSCVLRSTSRRPPPTAVCSDVLFNKIQKHNHCNNSNHFN